MIQDLERKQAEEAAELTRAEEAYDAARNAAEEAAKGAQRVRDDAENRLKADVKPSSQQLSSLDAEQLRAIEEEVKVAHAEALKAEAQRQAALAAAKEARSHAEEAQTSSGASTLARSIQAELKRVGCFARDGFCLDLQSERSSGALPKGNQEGPAG